MSEYIEIENPKEISQLNKTLSEKLTKALQYEENRVIGYPRGRFNAKVRFFSSNEQDMFWWASTKTKDKAVVHNFFGHGTPKKNIWLNIDVQFNLPIIEFSRRSGGTFLKHIPTGTILLAHRGIVTLGHGRIQRSALYAEMTATLQEADTSSGSNEFLLIGDLESPTLVDEIDEFATELRCTVKDIKGRSENDKGIGANTRSTKGTTPLIKLRAYFDEFNGQKKVKGRTKTIADCYHGSVVRALRDTMVNSAEVLKTGEIDLIAITKSKAFIFEVKTSARSQSIYTGVGQLMIHAPVVVQHVGNLLLEKVLVLPEEPADRLHQCLTKQLGIRLLTFVRSPKGRITLMGLDKLL